MRPMNEVDIVDVEGTRGGVSGSGGGVSGTGGVPAPLCVILIGGGAAL